MNAVWMIASRAYNYHVTTIILHQKMEKLNDSIINAQIFNHKSSSKAAETGLYLATQ